MKEELGFDAAIDYKSEDVRKAIAQHCPKGVDVYFDNVGGGILEAALANLALVEGGHFDHPSPEAQVSPAFGLVGPDTVRVAHSTHLEDFGV